eukprot:jgi/Orpsp1_1/1179757/evm.model.c7180000070664.1
MIPDDTKINILVKSSNYGIEQYMNTGYILLNSNKIVENIGEKGNLYYCESKEEYKQGPSTVQCNIVNDISNGIYLNNKLFNDKRYIKCSNNVCMIEGAIEINECQSSGLVIYNNNKHKLCISKDKEMELTNISENQKLIMNVDLKDNFPGVNEDNSCIIIGIEKEKIYYIKITSYILTNKYNNILVDNNKKDQNYNTSDDNNEVKNSLYSCKNGICTEIKLPSDGFYLKSNDQKSNELILCENNNCIFMNIGDGITELPVRNMFNEEEGYYWNKADKEGNGIILQIFKESNDIEFGESLNNSTLTKFKFLINKCLNTKNNVCITTQKKQIIQKGSSCVVLEGTNNGLYFATGNISNTSNDINCMKYENSTLYEYISNSIQFADSSINKIIIKVDKNDIKPFKHDISNPDDKTKYDDGYYFIDENKKL